VTERPSAGDCAPVAPLTEPADSRPPLGSWARAYAIVLVALAVDLLLLWLLTERYR